MPTKETEAKQRPKNYFIFHFRFLRFLGLGWWHNPAEGDTNNFPLSYIPYCIITQMVWVVGFVGLETVDPFIGVKEMERFMFNLSFVITHDLTLVKLYLFFFKNKDIQDVARTLEIDMYDHYQNYEKNRATIKSVRLLTRVYWFFGLAAIANSNIMGAIQDYRWKRSIKLLDDNVTASERTLAQPVFIPWDYQEDRVYIVTFILEACGLLWTGHIVLIIDTFIGAVILHMSAQFRTLQEALTSFYDRAMLELRNGIRDDNQLKEDQDIDEVEKVVRAYYSPEKIEDTLERMLHSCIRQHQVLIRDNVRKEILFRDTNIRTATLSYSCVDKFAEMYSYGFLTQLISSMGAICVIMVQVSVDVSSFKSIRFATSLAFFFAMIMQLAMQCITGNELTLQTLGVAQAVWCCKWERLPPRLRRELVLVGARAQRPLKLSAAGFADMNNECFVSILKAAYSYYAVISQKNG